jgi:hypothetical protein
VTARRSPAPRRGRPAVGGRTSLRLSPELRARLDAARPQGEGLADQVRRLLAAALDPELPGLLEMAAAAAYRGGEVARAKVAGDLAARVNGPGRRGGAR